MRVEMMRVLVLSLWACAASVHAQSTPWVLEDNLSTKTPYSPVEAELGDIKTEEDTCKAIQVQHVGRHGTRYPTKNTQHDIASLWNTAKEQKTLWGTSYLKPPFDKLMDWEAPWSADKVDDLTDIGVAEITGIATRLKKAYPELFSDASKMRVRSTDKYRSIHTARTFMDTIFPQSEVPVEQVKRADPVMDPPKGCPRWLSEIGSHDSYALYEVDEYQVGNEFLTIAAGVGARIGFQGFRAADLRNTFKACQAEVDVGVNNSLWCQALTQRDIEVLNYHEDLEAFYEYGYGHEISHHCAVALLDDMWTSVQKALSGQSEGVVGDFRFGHSSTVLPLLALMGLFKDDYDLVSERSAFDSLDRKWKTSAIDKMASNVMLVVYECSGGNHKLQLYVDERETLIPGCRRMLCEPDNFHRAFKPYLKQGAYKDICEVDPDANNISPMVFSLLASCVLGLVSATLAYSYYSNRYSIVPSGQQGSAQI